MSKKYAIVAKRRDLVISMVVIKIEQKKLYLQYLHHSLEMKKLKLCILRAFAPMFPHLLYKNILYKLYIGNINIKPDTNYNFNYNGAIPTSYARAIVAQSL